MTPPLVARTGEPHNNAQSQNPGAANLRAMHLNRAAVVIPAYGQPEMTHHIVADCLREEELAHVIVVDNAGDFTPPPGSNVQVIRPATNLGWLRGTNLGMDEALRAGFDWMVALNNDTRLSRGFFAGLRDALQARPADLVAPCYDDHYETQNGYYRGPAAAFPVEPVEISVPMIDGTCYALTTDLLDALGSLDAKHFGRRGWGGIDDYILRARGLGSGCVVTHRAYLQHARGSTGHAVMSSYERYASAEMRRGMRRKHGRHWRRHFALSSTTPDSPPVVLRDTLRAIEDRLGLSETAIGRR